MLVYGHLSDRFCLVYALDFSDPDGFRETFPLVKLAAQTADPARIDRPHPADFYREFFFILCCFNA
jgi:hypothetical protein